MASDPDLCGRELGRYRLVRKLGAGGMGVVYEAVHLQLGSRSAIKVLRRQHARRAIFRERFIREAQASAAIGHPNVVAIQDFGETPEGWPFYVMEFLEGGDLRAYLRACGPFAWEVLVPLFQQACSALSAAHRRGVVHRDIKPANCFVVGDIRHADACRLKLLDFGIARLLQGDGQKLTLAGQVLGTPAYMAPEVALGHPADARSDVYSLAVTLHKLLTGQFPGRPQAESWAHVPPALRPVLQHALARDPEQRFPSVDSFAAALFEPPAVTRFATPGPRNRAAAYARRTRVAASPTDMPPTEISRGGTLRPSTLAMEPLQLAQPSAAAPSPGATSASVPGASTPPRGHRWWLIGVLLALAAAALVGWALTRGARVSQRLRATPEHDHVVRAVVLPT